MTSESTLRAHRRAARRRLARQAPRLLQTAVRCARTGNYARATRMARQVARLAPDYPTAWNVLGDLHFAQGHGLAAAIALQECLRLAPDSAMAHATLGELALRSDAPRAAREHLAAALAGDRALPAKRRAWTEALLARVQ